MSSGTTCISALPDPPLCLLIPLTSPPSLLWSVGSLLEAWSSSGYSNLSGCLARSLKVLSIAPEVILGRGRSVFFPDIVVKSFSSSSSSLSASVSLSSSFPSPPAGCKTNVVSPSPAEPFPLVFFIFVLGLAGNEFERPLRWFFSCFFILFCNSFRAFSCCCLTKSG